MNRASNSIPVVIVAVDRSSWPARHGGQSATFLLICAIVAIGFSPSCQSLLIYDRAAILKGEFWRIATGNLVHLSAQHLFWNALVLGAAGVRIERQGYAHFGWLCAFSSIAIGVALLALQPSVLVYAGASGIATAAVVYLALNGLAAGHQTRTWRGMCLAGLLLVCTKIFREFVSGRSMFVETAGQGLMVSPTSHLVGALVASLVFLVRKHSLLGRPRPRRLIRAAASTIAIAAAPLVLTGCMTYKLWDGEMIESFHEPASPDGLALLQPTNSMDIIVQYDELSPWRNTVRRRTYFLHQNEERIQERKKPIFADAAVTNGAAPIPIVAQTNGMPKVSAASGLASPHAVRLAEGNEFTIVRANGLIEGPFHLPGYRGATGNLRLIGFTPVTVTADATIVVGVAGYIYLCALAQSGGGPLWPCCH
jgi:rhomboid family GlyGly-CTERM serine protease